eukprot:1445263-Prymnesium_polylepis.1
MVPGHSGHARARSLRTTEKLWAVTLLRPLTDGGGFGSEALRRNPYPDHLSGLGVRKVTEIAWTVSPRVTGCCWWQGLRQRDRASPVDFCAVWASWTAL